MNKNLLVLLSAVALLGVMASARADERQERHERFEHREARECHEGREFHGGPRMVYDNRYRHNHYYPAPGFSVSVLPTGNVGVRFGRGRYFFHAGVWYRPGPAGYIVVRPPIGIVVPILPLGYSTLWVGNRPYYYANDVYYTGNPGAYVVTAAPSALGTATVEAPVMAEMPAPVGPSSAPPQAPGTWYYCESAKAYYPYVDQCSEGWRPVPAMPPGN